MGAKYSLRLVHEAAQGERVELDESRARDEVLRFFSTLLECYPFAAGVLLELRDEDFSETISLPNPPHGGLYDVYGIRISETLASKHSVTVREWYLKLRLYESWSGETVFLVSLHPLGYPLRRVGGVLKPGGLP